MRCSWAFPTTTGRYHASHAYLSTRVISCVQSSDHGLRSGNKAARAHAYKIRKWRPQQQTAVGQCYEQLFDHSNFEAIKTLSGLSAPHCDKSICFMLKWWRILELFSSYHYWMMWSEQRRGMALVFICFPQGCWAIIWVFLIMKALKEEAWVLK